MNKDYKNKRIIDGFNTAIEGIFDTIRTEKHMKFHAFITVIVLVLALMYDIKKSSLISIIICISIVWIAELLNTAIECCIDIYCKEYNELAKKAKDSAAGAVLIASLASVLVGYITFASIIENELRDSFSYLKNSFQNTTVFIFIVVILIVIVLKLGFRRGTPLRGGIPSGHSALAGSIFMIITFLSDDSKIFFLTLIMLVLVLQSRVEGKIHTFFETVVGAFLGMGITYCLLRILNL